MAIITDPQVVKFSNERLRVLSRTVATLFSTIGETEAEWFGFVSALIAGNDGADTLDDGRASQGVSVLTKDDITNVVTRVIALKDVLDAANAMDVIHKVKVGG